MILYSEDWKKYPGAIPDFDTRNRTFVKFSATLDSLGVKNCLFPLALMDQRLKGIDPRSPDLTPEQMHLISREVRENPWYFIREILRLPGQGIGGQPIEANRGIIALWWNVLNNFDVYSIQPRQTGKSVGVDGLHLWRVMFQQFGADSILVTKDSKLVVKNTKRLKEMRELLPSYLWLPTKKDKDVEDQFNYGAKKNVLLLACAQRDPISANNQGRGFTTACLHIDEVPFVKYVHILLPAASSSTDRAVFDAMRNGEPYGKIYTTTPGDLSTEEGLYAYNLFEEGCSFTEAFYDQPNREAVTEIMFKNTGLPNPRMSLLYSHRMLGISDDEMWRRIRSVQSTDEAINKDYFLIWGKGGVSSVIPEEIIRDMDSSIKQPDYNELTETGYIVKWYLPKDTIESFMANNKILIGCDTSEQIGRDSTTFVLVNPINLQTVATIGIANATIISATKWFAKFMLRYPNTIYVPEKKSSAQTFIDALITSLVAEGINPFKRIWNRIVDQPHEHRELYDIIKRSSIHCNTRIEQLAMENRKLFGFNQNYNTRMLLYTQVLQEAASQCRHVVYDQTLVNQIARLKIREDGKIDHRAGEHDDYVMAWLLVHWVLRYGKHLDFYGIDSTRVMMTVSKNGKQLNDEDLEELARIDELKAMLEELSQDYQRSTLYGLKARLEKQIELVNKELSQYGIETKTLDGVKVQHQQDKRQRRLSLQTR